MILDPTAFAPPPFRAVRLDPSAFAPMGEAFSLLPEPTEAEIAARDFCARSGKDRGTRIPFDLDSVPATDVPAPSELRELFASRALPGYEPTGEEWITEDGLRIDRDGYHVPEIFWLVPSLWYDKSATVRRKLGEVYLDRWYAEHQAAIKAAKKHSEPQAERGPTKKFSTQYAKTWGTQQGWKYIEREWTDQFGKTHDLQFGMDLRFDGPGGSIMVQAAGKGQRAAHYQRFLERGGIEGARRHHTEIYYVEFARDLGPKPILLERWA